MNGSSFTRPSRYSRITSSRNPLPTWRRPKLEPFIQAFGDSYEVPLEGTPAELADRAVKALELPMGAESIVNAWAMDGSRSAGMTMGGLVNALTRASQDLPVADAEEVEVAAGKLVDEGLKALGLV